MLRQVALPIKFWTVIFWKKSLKKTNGGLDDRICHRWWFWNNYYCAHVFSASYSRDNYSLLQFNRFFVTAGGGQRNIKLVMCPVKKKARRVNFKKRGPTSPLHQFEYLYNTYVIKAEMGVTKSVGDKVIIVRGFVCDRCRVTDPHHFIADPDHLHLLTLKRAPLNPFTL